MNHLPDLILDLALILGSAAVVTLLFKKLKQPVVLGYIIAGLLVGPNFNLFPSITNVSDIKVWADIGVIILLFNLGLEFSFKKLVKVGGTAAITGIFEVSCMLLIGYIIGQLMGWNLMDSIFLGGIIAISSTTIIVRAFDELGIKTKKFTGIVLGVLVIEDLVAVILMVLLSTLALSKNFQGGEMIASVLKLGFFLILWFLAGIFIIPSFLKVTKKLVNDETMLVISLALCLLMVVLASTAGFSPALGAFIMGSILAETTQAEKIEHLVKSIKDLFGAVFFVSVGMLIDPNILKEYGLQVVVLTLAVIIGKSLFVTTGALLSGQPLKQSMQSGMSLSQIGEFSFIIASLGLTLGVTSDFLYPIAVGVSVITTFTTPYMIKLAEPTCEFLEKVLPDKWQSRLERYSAGAQSISSTSDWQVVLRSYIITMVTNSVIIMSIMIVSLKFVAPHINLGHDILSATACAVGTLLAMAPFLWALTLKRSQTHAYYNLWLNSKFNRGPLVTLELSRIGLAIFFVGFLFDRLLSTKIAVVIVMAVAAVILIIFSRRLQAFYHRIERRFLFNLNARQVEKQLKRGKELLPWDAHLTYFEVSPDSPLIGKTLLELSLREHYGVNIAIIERGKRIINVPPKEERVYPGDRIAVIGTDEQLKIFGAIVEEVGGSDYLPVSNEVSLQQVLIGPGFPYIGKSIRESDIRAKTGGLIVGLERDRERILNPDSSLVFKLGDILWIVGNVALIQELLKNRAPVPQLEDVLYQPIENNIV